MARSDRSEYKETQECVRALRKRLRIWVKKNPTPNRKRVARRIRRTLKNMDGIEFIVKAFRMSVDGRKKI